MIDKHKQHKGLPMLNFSSVVRRKRTREPIFNKVKLPAEFYSERNSRER